MDKLIWQETVLLLRCAKITVRESNQTVSHMFHISLEDSDFPLLEIIKPVD